MHTGAKRDPAARQRGSDLVAGLCVAGLLLPEAMAYAGLAHLPPGQGLIAMIIGLAVYGVLGGSRFAIVSPTSSTATLAMAAVISMYPGQAVQTGAGYGQAVLALVLLAGLALVVLGLTRQGQLTSYISRPVLKGFAFALAVSIVARQLPDAMGFVLPPSASGDVFHVALNVLGSWNAWQIPSIAMALSAAALLVWLRRWPQVPASLLVIVLAIVATRAFALEGIGIALVGQVATPAFAVAIPDLTRAEWLRAGELAFGLVMLVFAESWGSMRALALEHGETLDPNRELVVLGGCNIVSALLQGMPVGAGFSATNANAAAGAVSRRAGWVALAAVLATVTLAMPSIAYLPRPVLAVAVISALWHALSLRPMLTIWRMERDRMLLLSAVLAVLYLGVLHGLLVAIGLSILAALRRFSQPVVHELGELGQTRNYVDLHAQTGAQASPGMLIVRPEVPLFFGSAERVVAQIMQLVREHGDTRTVILSLEESADLDSTAVDCLQELSQGLLQTRRTLVLARVKTTVRTLLAHADPQGLGADGHLFWSVADAVAYVQRAGASAIAGV